MRLNSSIVTLGVLIGVCSFTQTASAYLHSSMGRFLSRDPIANSATADQFVTLKSVHQLLPFDEYRDGMNLYQYERSNPVRYNDVWGEFIKGRGKFDGNLKRNDDYSSNFVMRFTPSAVVKSQCLCDRIEFVQYVHERSNSSWRDEGVSWSDTGWILDTADPYPHQKPWIRTENSSNASMEDAPGASTWTFWAFWSFTQEFETFAMCKAGKEAGNSYGAVHWSHSFNFGSTTRTVTRTITGATPPSRSGPTSSPDVAVYLRDYGPPN
jgi:hypothetical protein